MRETERKREKDIIKNYVRENEVMLNYGRYILADQTSLNKIAKMKIK